MKTDYSPLISEFEFESEAQEASYTAWLNAKVQASLNDPPLAFHTIKSWRKHGL